MPRYIDAERFKLWVQENYVLYDGDRYLKDIDEQPTADVVKGVRCLLCEHFDPTSPSGTVEPTLYFCKRRKIYVDPYDCCAFGDRKEEKTDE